MASGHVPLFLLAAVCCLHAALSQNDSSWYYVSEWYCEEECKGGYPSPVRWGEPGLWCEFTALGYISSDNSSDTDGVMVPWVGIVMQMDSQTNGGVKVSPVREVGEEDDYLPVEFIDVYDTICWILSSTVVNTSEVATETRVNMTLCVQPVLVSVYDQGQKADLAFFSTLNVTYYSTMLDTGDVNVLWDDLVWNGTYEEDGVDCEEWRIDIILMVIATFQALFVPFLIYWFCPPAVGVRDILPAVPNFPSDTSCVVVWWGKLIDKLSLALTDSYMWGSFTYLLAAVLYVWNRQAPDFFLEHEGFANVFYVFAAGLYVISAAFYHMGYDKSPDPPSFAAEVECYTNTWGSVGFVVSAVMYMWYDYDNMSYTTTLFELGMYVFWMFEAFSCGWCAAYDWYERQDTLRGLSCAQYIWLALGILFSPVFWGCFLSFVGTTLYLASSSKLSEEYVGRYYMDDDETVEYYEEYGYTAPTYGYLSFPDTLTIQVTADFCYLFSAIFYMYVAWKYFDPRETEAYTTNPALVEEAVGTSSDTASLDGDVQLVATHKTDSEDVHVTLLPDSLSPGAAYGTARIVDDRPQTRRVYDVKAAHVELLKWVFCCGCRRQVPQTQFY